MEWETVIGVAVAGLVSVCSVIAGGAITLAGTVLAWWLGQRAEREERKNERLDERLDEVSEYVALHMQLAEYVCVPSGSQGKKLEDEVYEAWALAADSYLEKASSLPRIRAHMPFTVKDDQLRELLRQIADQGAEFAKYLKVLAETRVVPSEAWESKKALDEAAEKAYKRIEELRP